MDELYENTIEAELSKNGSYAACAKGESMKPMLRGGRDMVIIVSPKREIKKYDVILYRDALDRYVLHRVIRVKKDKYLTRGDNTFVTEHIPKENVLGILTAYNKNGKRYEANAFKNKLYARLRCFSYPFRKLFRGLYSLLARIYRKIFKKRKK